MALLGLLGLFLGGGGTQSTAAAPLTPLTTLFVVHDGSGLLANGAEVYRNCVFVGTTNGSGQLSVPGVVAGDHIQARLLTYTGPSSKGSHGGWSYHVWRTNIIQYSNGSQGDYLVTNAGVTNDVYLDLEQNQIGFNIVASVEYNATSANLSEIATGLQNASTYLFDVTDGQIYFERATIYEDKQNFNDADMQFYASAWPSANVWHGPAAVADPCCHMYLPGPGFYGSWTQPDAYRTIGHEFGHYAVGAFDEYFNSNGPSSCTSNRGSQPEQDRASIMDYQYNATEFCYDSTHNASTSQGEIMHQSVWATLAGYYNASLRTIYTPMLRGGDDPGPYSLTCFDAMTPTIVSSNVNACPTLTVHLVDLSNNPLPNWPITLFHNGDTISEGMTDGSGNLYLYGAVTGDIVSGSKVVKQGNTVTYYSGQATVTACTDVTVRVIPWISYYVQIVPRYFAVGPTFWLRIPIPPGPVMPSFDAFVEQNGLNRQQVTLTYNIDLHQYEGFYPVNAQQALDFGIEIDTHNGQNEITRQSFHYEAAQFQAAGPSGASEAQAGGKIPATPPAGWQIFRADSGINMIVNTNSLPNGTGVTAGDTNLPANPPAGMYAVGGPLSVDGENPLSGSANLSIRYEVDNYCSLEESSIAIYYFNGTDWAALPTTLDTSNNTAWATITQFGIYAVFATPNPVPSFSDVPEESTFYSYVEWMACHGAVSGYADGTFRPGNNATRGQIAKMVALAYNWNLEPLPGGDYTFADVHISQTFYLQIEAAYGMGVFNGYPCGGPGEPCDGRNRPYFRPGNDVTRGQIAKILSNASQFNEPPTGQTFEDVPPTDTFYAYIERLASRDIIAGYACGEPGEPCGTGNRPYFRPGANASRGQISKIIYGAVQPH